MSLSHKSITMFRTCPVCSNILSSRARYIDPSGESTVVYSCEHPICCDVHPYTRYMATYENDIECVSAQIILKIDNENYRLSFNTAQNITQFGKITNFIAVESALSHIHKEICTLNYVLDWYDSLSAYQVISRLLKIKVFS